MAMEENSTLVLSDYLPPNKRKALLNFYVEQSLQSAQHAKKSIYHEWTKEETRLFPLKTPALLREFNAIKIDLFDLYRRTQDPLKIKATPNMHECGGHYFNSF